MSINLGVFEDAGWQRLLPLTWLRPACSLICGTDRLIDKVIAACETAPAGYWARSEWSARIGESLPHTEPDSNLPWCLVNARTLWQGAEELPPEGTAWIDRGEVLAVSVPGDMIEGLTSDLFLNPERLAEWIELCRQTPPPEGVRLIRYPWDLVLANADELTRQCKQGGRHEGIVYDGVHFLEHQSICIEPGAKIKAGVVLDAEKGPIHIASKAVIEPNAYIEGPAYIGPRSLVRPFASIRGGTTIGPVCKIGGEIEATVFQGYANKQHDGFFGHSYLGEWTNIGAGTTTSDLKNTYGTIRVFLSGVGVESGEQFVGSIIGDHSKTGIGTLLPTGCVVGVAANVFTTQAVPKFVPSFGWLTDAGLAPYRLEKALSIARVVMGRRDHELTHAEAELLTHVVSAARDIEKAGWASD
jgi:UDP-N-acetylglucosamine diphosphorylase/glucosamine-1-phosphate N-acetyltransferase